MFTPRAQNPLLAIALMLAATSFIAATTLLAKALGTGRLGPEMHPLQISFGRFLFAFLLISTTVAVMRPRIGRPAMRLHIGRTILGWGGVTLMFASVAYIPLSDATAISFLNPVFAMILAIPFLGERVGPVRWLGAAIALCGALILLRPTPESFQPAALLALGAALFLGAEVIFIKKLSGREGPFQILLINNTLGLCIASAAAFTVWQSPTAAQWGAMALLGGAMACAQMLFVNAMARADASLVVPISYATLVFATFYDVAIFAVWPDATSVFGAAVILTGAAVIAWREARLRASAGSRA